MKIVGDSMPTLDFKGKPFVYSHHLSVPFRELKIDAAKSLPSEAGPSLDDNLIIHGDNLHALKALLPKYAGKDQRKDNPTSTLAIPQSRRLISTKEVSKVSLRPGRNMGQFI